MPRRVLLVDDDIAEISAVKRLLLRAGCQSVLATNASDARATASQQQIDVAVVAASCDGGEGLRLGRELVSGAHTRPIPLILLGDVADVPSGASVVPQPVDPSQLAEELKRMLDGAHPPKPARPSDDPPQGLRPSAPPPPRPPGPDHAERRAAADALRNRAAELRSGGARTTMTLPAASLPRVGEPAPFMASPLGEAPDPGSALDLLPSVSPEEQIARDIQEVTGEPDPGGELDPAREPLTLIDAEPLAARLLHEQAQAALEQSDPPAPSLSELEPELDELLFSPALVEEAQAGADADADAETENARQTAEEQARAALEEEEAEAEAERARLTAEEHARTAAESARLAAEEQARAEAEAELEQMRRADQEAEDAAHLAAERARAETELEETRRAAEQEAERARRATDQVERVRREQEADRAQLTAERAKAAEVELARRAAEQEAGRARMMAEQARAEAESERARREQDAQDKTRAEEAAELARRDAERAQAEAESERARRVEMVEETARLEAEAQERTERVLAAEEKAEAEAEARHRAEEELRLAGERLELERREHGAALARERERAQAEQRAAEELRVLAQQEEQRKAAVRLTEVAELRKKEEELRRAAEAAELARRELAEERKRTEEEARRRVETERELARLAQESQKEKRRVEGAQRRAEIEAELERFAREEEAIEPREEQPTGAAPPPQSFQDDDPERDALDAAFQRAATQDALSREATQEAARRKVLAMAADKKGAPAGRPAVAEPPPPPRAWMPPVPPRPRGPEAAPALAPVPVPAVAVAPLPPRAAPVAPAATAQPGGAAPTPTPDASELQELDASTVPPVLSAGSTSEFPIPRLLALAVRAALSGRLDFTSDAPRSLYFEEGRIVGATSGAPHERVEEVALRNGLITRDQFRTVATAAAGLSSRRVAVLLLERGFLKPTELTSLVRRRTEDILFNLFGDGEARYRYAAARVPPDERVALERGTLALAVEGVRRRWLAPRLDPLLGGPGTLLAPAPDPTPLAELGLSPQEQRLAQSADGLRTNDEVVAGADMDPLSARQCLAALLMIGNLSLRIHVPLGTGQVAAAKIDLGRVREKLDQVRRADYFTILGLPRLCSPHEIREAAARLEGEFDAQRFAGYSEDGLADKLAEIQRVLREAREVLADDQLRAEYIRGLGD